MTSAIAASPKSGAWRPRTVIAGMKRPRYSAAARNGIATPSENMKSTAAPIVALPSAPT